MGNHHDCHDHCDIRESMSLNPQTRASLKYAKKTYTQVKVALAKAKVAEFKVACQKLGKSQRSVIEAAIDDVIKKASQID